MVMEYLEGYDLVRPPPAARRPAGARGARPALAALQRHRGRPRRPASCTAISSPPTSSSCPGPRAGFSSKFSISASPRPPRMQASVQTQQGAARRSAALTQLTQTASLLGSARYMAPEQMESARDVDARADLWSIGVIGYRMLTGKNPFEGESFEELFLARSAWGGAIPLGQAAAGPASPAAGRDGRLPAADAGPPLGQRRRPPGDPAPRPSRRPPRSPARSSAPPIQHRRDPAGRGHRAAGGSSSG